MKLTVAWMGNTKQAAIRSLTEEYLKRLAHYADVEGKAWKDESAWLAWNRRARSKTQTTLVLLDAGGKQLSSEELAKFLGDHRDRHPWPLEFAVGPASGFSEEARRAATVRLSLGRMTLAHELARVVLLEQLYRAFTILRGHPYHLAH